MIDHNTARSIWLFQEQTGVGGLTGHKRRTTPAAAFRKLCERRKDKLFSDEI
jgi:hypothetical protein